MSSFNNIENADFGEEMQYSLDKEMKMAHHMVWIELLINMDKSMRGTLAMGKAMDLEERSVLVAQELDGGEITCSKVMAIILDQMDLFKNQVGLKMV